MRRLSFKFVFFIVAVFLFSSIVIALTLGGSIGTVISIHSDDNISNNSSNETNSTSVANVTLPVNVTINDTNMNITTNIIDVANQTGNNTIQNATNMTENGGSSSGTANPIYDNKIKPTTYDVRFDNSNHKGENSANENIQIRGVGFVEVQDRDTRGIRPAG